MRVGEVDEARLGDVDALVLDLLARLAGNQANAAGEWESDQKIVAMYSRDVDINIPH